ncbi:MAG: zinc ribbon domain-containing protein [Acidobacteria bacterium]|nr:zinc ribbon domain-containing protein [Acidobacteriota bacterium]
MMKGLGEVLGALALILLSAVAAAPQAPIVLSDLAIDVWPDYDRPGVLVIYRATLAPESPRPARLVFRIPASAGLPSAVAERPTGGQLLTLQYVRTVEGDTALIELTASQAYVQLEYYDPLIARDSASRSFSFTWHGDFDVQRFEVSLQQPHLAQNFTTVPEAPVATASADGLVYHALSRVGVARGETISVQASYEKVSDQLSVETLSPTAVPAPLPALQPTPVTGGGAPPAGETGRVVVGALVVAAAAVIAGLMFRTRRQARSAAAASASARATGSALPSESSGEAKKKFCTQCGSGVNRGDRFCRFCGTPIKS